MVAAVAPGANAKAEIEFLGAVRALATAAGMFDLTEGTRMRGRQLPTRRAMGPGRKTRRAHSEGRVVVGCVGS